MIAAAAVAVVVAVLVAGVAFLQGGGKSAVKSTAVMKLTEIEGLAPLDTHQLVLTPGLGQDNEWWNTLIAFMPPAVRLDNLRPTADLGITNLGYSFSAADRALGLDQGYVRMLYVETDSAEHALKVKGWLSSSIGAAQGAFWSSIRGHTVVLITSDIPMTSAVLPKSGAGLGSTAAFRQDTAERDGGSLFWEDWGGYVKAAGASGGRPLTYSRYFYGATGFIQGSRWVGYSTSPQVGWSGEFTSGGMDSKLVSATNVAAAIGSYRKVLQKDAQGIPIVSDAGAGNYLREGFYVRHPVVKTSQLTMGSVKLAFKPKGEGDTAFSFDPSAWLAGTSVSGSAGPEGLSLFAYSIKGKRVNLKVTVNEALKRDRLADPTPVRTFAPPPDGPPPGYGRVPIPTQTTSNPDDVRTPTAR